MLLVLNVAEQIAAISLDSVDKITPMAQLARPLGLPSSLEGILNLAGAAVPVLRLSRLFQLPAEPPGLYSMLIVVKGVGEERIAMLVERASEIVTVPESALLPVGDKASFNGCAEAAVRVRGQLVHVLSPKRILLEQERAALSEFQATAERRIQEWQPKQ